MSAGLIGRAREDAVPEPRGEALDLGLDRAVMSSVQPCGTWQYAQPMCLPGGGTGRVEEAAERG